jgi:hypothetical protein
MKTIDPLSGEMSAQSGATSGGVSATGLEPSTSAANSCSRSSGDPSVPTVRRRKVSRVPSRVNPPAKS